MIDVIVSGECPHCETQIEHMKKSFFEDEYRIIRTGTKEFEALPEKDEIDAVPFVIVRDDDDLSAKYAARGVHDGTKLRKIERGPVEPFNLHKRTAAQA